VGSKLGIVSLWLVGCAAGPVVRPTPEEAPTITVSRPTIEGLSNVVDIAVGAVHACALTSEGRVACWGNGRFFQLGDVSNGGRNEPRFIPGLDRAIGLDAGFTATCAQLVSGELVCWGAQYNGMVDVVHDEVKAPVTVVPPFGWPRGFAVGGERAAFFGGDGGISVWTPPVESPVPIDGFDEAVEVVVGWLHVCARRRDGSVRCLGPNHGGECGNGGDGEEIEPVSVVGASELDGALFEKSYYRCGLSPAKAACATTLGGVVDLDAFGRVTCAVLDGGRVACWGAARTGSKWLGGIGFSRVPVLIPGLNDAVEVEVGGWHACARRKGGTVACWGDNYAGQLGGLDGDVQPQTTPVEVAQLVGVVQLSAGHETTCARLESGKVTCWGAPLVKGEKDKDSDGKE
jgi:alpha-tubulin suppressor-like RCC1 family protein